MQETVSRFSPGDEAVVTVIRDGKEKKIDVKKIEMQTVEDLTELVDFTKLQLA